MTLLTYSAACLAFCAGFALLQVVPLARSEMALLWQEVSVLGAADLGDDEKERHARRAAMRAMGGAGQLFLRLAGAACATLVPVGLSHMAGIADAGAVADFALRPDVMAVTTLAAVLLLVLARRRAGRA